MFIYAIFKVRALRSMGTCQCCHGNRWRSVRMDEAGLSLAQAGAKPHLWFGASHLMSWNVLLSLCSGSRCCGRWEKEKLGLGGWVWGRFWSLHTISLVFPYLKHFLLVTQGWGLRKDLLVMGADKCDCSCLRWFRPALLLPFCVSTNVTNAKSVSSVQFTFPPPNACIIVPTHTWKTHGSICLALFLC